MTTMDRPRTSPNPRPTLDEAVNEIAELRPLSAVATQILAITEGDQFCAQELAKVVSADQALSAKMLRLSNSPYYGFPRRITTVRDAIVLLGFRAVRSATMSSCVIDAVHDGYRNLNADTFWRYSVAVASLSELLAKAERRPHEEAFTAGVVHNIGRLALDQHYPHLLREAIEYSREHEVRLSEAERAVLGFTSAELGGGLALSWNFPEPLARAVALHDANLYLIEDPRSLEGIVRRARAFAAAIGLSDGADRALEAVTPPEWNVPPLAAHLEHQGGVQGVLRRVDAFLDHAIA